MRAGSHRQNLNLRLQWTQAQMDIGSTSAGLFLTFIGTVCTSLCPMQFQISVLNPAQQIALFYVLDTLVVTLIRNGYKSSTCLYCFVFNSLFYLICSNSISRCLLTLIYLPVNFNQAHSVNVTNGVPSFGNAGCYVMLSVQCVFVLSTLDGHPLTASLCLVVFSRRKAVADAVSESPWQEGNSLWMSVFSPLTPDASPCLCLWWPCASVYSHHSPCRSVPTLDQICPVFILFISFIKVPALPPA